MKARRLRYGEAWRFRRKLTLDIVTPDRSLVHEEVDEVELPGAEGYFGVLPGHTPLLAVAAGRRVWYRTGQREALPGGRGRLRRSAARSRDGAGAGRRDAPRTSTWRAPRPA